MTLSNTQKIKALGLPIFRPLPFIKSGFAQTIASAFWPNFPDSKPTSVHQVSLADDDNLMIVEDRPQKWRVGDRIALLVHGLAGHHQSNYMIRITRQLVANGILVLRVNLRGCGIGIALAKQPYHCGRSEDSRTILRWISLHFPGSPVTQVGFSLGANITLKMAGEDAQSPTGNLDSIVAISPPVDLAATAKHLRQTKYSFFDQFFVWKLKHDIWRHRRHFPDLPKLNFPLRMNLTDLDDLYTAPLSGFENAQDYYAKASSGPFISNIQVRSLILCSSDDPIVHTQSYSNLKIPSLVDLIMTEAGGHVGFIGGTDQPTDFQWMDKLITRWILTL